MSTFVAIDFETADKAKGGACAVAVVRVEGTRVVRQEARLVNPLRPILPMFTRDVHGISDAMVRTAPPWQRVWPELAPLLEGAIWIIAHNASFDRGVLEHEHKQVGFVPPASRFWIDTLALAREAFPTWPSHKLNVCCERLGIPLKHHDPLSDALAAADLYLRIEKQGPLERIDGAGTLAPSPESERKAAFAARMMGGKSAPPPAPEAAPVATALAPFAPEHEADPLQGYSPESAEETARRVARGELEMPLGITDPWLGRVLTLAHANERLRQNMRRVLAHFGITREQALEALGRGPQVVEQGGGEAESRKPAVHPRCCGACGTKNLDDNGQCTKCGWRRERAA